jgi:serine protease Do
MLIAGHCVFGQTSALRDYVGLISQSFHPDAVEILEKLKAELEKRNKNVAARSLDAYIKGGSGTGFVYVSGGVSYILTNYHVISQADILSVTFEKVDGEQTKFTGLTIIAADEEMDIALLVFAGGQNPFKDGLRFVTRAVEEGTDVYSAGFPGLGSSMIWQLGRGMVSNASVRIPLDDGSGKVMGPFIQHTAQVDPGNSGGPLLIQTQGVPTGFAVAGINTLKAFTRQAANYSIPVPRIQTFLTASLSKEKVDERALLDTKLEVFVEGLKVNRAVYPHIAPYLSNTYVGENAERALSEMLNKASRMVQDDILNTFGNSPVNGMRHAVAWSIENQIRSKTGSLNIALDSVTANDTAYTVIFKINDNLVSSEWVNEYGIWRVLKFGDSVTVDKEEKEQKNKADPKAKTTANPKTTTKPKTDAKPETDAKAKNTDKGPRIEPTFQLSLDYVHIFDRGPNFGIDCTFRSTKYFGYGIRGCFGTGMFQTTAFAGFYIPIKLSSAVGLTPFGNIGFGVQSKDTGEVDYWGDRERRLFFGLSAQGGLQFTTAAVPGLFLQAGYQLNWFGAFGFDSEKSKKTDVHAFFVGIGYSF